MRKRNTPEVLVVEDEITTRMVAADTISDMGLQVLEAGHADEALQTLKDHPDIGVLFTDIQMPGAMSGLDLAKRVHEVRPNVEIIVTSGGAKLDDCQLPDDGTFLSKPYHPSRLAEVVEQKVSSCSEESELQAP